MVIKKWVCLSGKTETAAQSFAENEKPRLPGFFNKTRSTFPLVKPKDYSISTV
jgi:hypothetical protein